MNYATDFAPQDSTLVARLRDQGAIIYAKAHNAEYNGGSGDPGGDAKVVHPMLATGGARETWGGVTCNPYDTARQTGGSSGGSGASVAANLAQCSICESTGGSCRSPGTHNGVVTFVPTKGMISYGGGIGADPYRDRPGITCRTSKTQPPCSTRSAIARRAASSIRAISTRRCRARSRRRRPT